MTVDVYTFYVWRPSIETCFEGGVKEFCVMHAVIICGLSDIDNELLKWISSLLSLFLFILSVQV